MSGYRSVVARIVGLCAVLCAAGPVAALATAGSASASVAFPAGSGSTTVTVGDSSEAWYATPAGGSCVAPGVCPSLVGSGLPAGTLHVAVAAGSEAARTYVTPDLSAVPAGFTPVAGTMTLPLATVAGNGNLLPQNASIRACLSFDPATDGTAGSTAAPPQIDCAVTAPVKAGAGAFSLDLGPFLAAWNSGQPEQGIALVPDLAGADILSGWHVSFDGRQLKGQPPITSTLQLQPAAGAGSAPSAPSAPAGSASGQGSGSAGSGTAPAGSGDGPASGGPVGEPGPAVGATAVSPEAAGTAPLAASPSLAAPSAMVAAPARGGRSAAGAPGAAAAGSSGTRSVAIAASARPAGGFRYPEAMLLPLVLLAGIVFALRLFTTDATPARRAPLHLTVDQKDRL